MILRVFVKKPPQTPASEIALALNRIKESKKLSALKKELMDDVEFKKEYDSLEQEFKFAGRMIEARLQARLSQEQVASRMGTTQSVVARIESGRPLPSIRTLMRYAAAVGRKLEIALPKAA